MKFLYTIVALLIAVSSFGQSAEEYLKAGIAKHNSSDYKGAIRDYDKAIVVDGKFRDAYFNRGTCQLALKEYGAAIADFTKTIAIDPQFAKAYYSRATANVSDEKYGLALPDLDKTIELDQAMPNALTLRGQLRVQAGNKIGACEDFQKAKEIGDPKAERYIAKYCGNEQQQGESLAFDWPDAEHWKVGDDQENSDQHVIDLIHENESIESWTELGNMTAIKGVIGVPVEKAMNLMYDQAKQHAPKAKLTFIEKDENATYPWILFTVESPAFTNDKIPESQLWYIVQGKQGLYTNFWAVKKSSITSAQKEKWSRFFKDGRIVNK